MLLVILEEDIKQARSGKINESIIKRFIPPPDYSKRKKAISMLPHVSAFANLYARINYVINEKTDIEIIHDEQAHFDEILRLQEKVFKSNKWADMLMANQARHPSTNYVFTERFNLQFAKSHECSGIQIADVIAGFCTRYFNLVQESRQTNEESGYGKTISLLRELSSVGNGQGVNIVASQASFNQFFLSNSL